jgi:signal transduction histidine kinase
MLYLDMARKDSENGEIYLIHASEYTLSAINEIRKLSKGLSSTTINEYGLCGTIEHITTDIMGASPVKIHYASDYSVEDGFNNKFKLNVYRILQEQLNNIIKHARAPNVYIVLSRSDTEFSVSIADDGIGCDLSQKKEGIGISNIISRANIYKGGAVFNSEHGKGCKLVVSFPISKLCLE